ncbi:hypothetical protein AKAW_02048 [Aspergillus luchuensis IFO 4308]|nr:hypothetical protein AKAW_02048 [Aspergillus luchuensis IFO 4308]
MGKHAPDKEFQSQAQTSVVLPPAGNDGRTRTPQIASPPKEARPDQPSTTPVSIGQTRSASLDHYWVLNGERRRSKPTVREGHVDPGSVFDSEWCASLELQGRPAKALRQQNGRMAERFFLGSQSRDVIWECKECKAGCSPAFICRSPTLFVHAAFSPLFPSSLLSPSSRGKRLPVSLPNALP